MRLFFLWALVCLGLAFAGASAIAEPIAEHKPVSAKSSSVSKAAPEAPQAEQQPNIDPVVLAMLIKSTILALQHANQTGNYSVLRDLGTPLFRERLSGGSEFAGWGLHPLESAALSRRTPVAGFPVGTAVLSGRVIQSYGPRMRRLKLQADAAIDGEGLARRDCVRIR